MTTFDDLEPHPRSLMDGNKPKFKGPNISGKRERFPMDVTNQGPDQQAGSIKHFSVEAPDSQPAPAEGSGGSAKVQLVPFPQKVRRCGFRFVDKLPGPMVDNPQDIVYSSPNQLRQLRKD